MQSAEQAPQWLRVMPRTRRGMLAGTVTAALGTGALSSCATSFPGPPIATQEAAGPVVVWAHPAFNWRDAVGGEIMADTMAKHPKLQITIETITDGSSIVRAQKLVAAAAAGTAPDITHVGTGDVQGLGKAGVILPVDRFLKASRVVSQADLWPVIVRDLTWQGQQYGMPWGPDLGVMLVNSGAMRAAGLDPEKPATTWDDFAEQVRRLYREVEPGRPARTAFHPLRGQSATQWLIPFWQQGGELLSPDGTKVTLNNELGIAALQWVDQVVKAQGGYTALESVGANRGDLWIAGTEGYWFANVAAPSQSQALVDAIKSGLRYVTSYWPIPKGGKRANFGGAHSFVISAQSKVPFAAWTVLENLSSEENNLKFAVFYNRIPIRVKTAQGMAFHKNDPRLKLAVEEMQNRRGPIAAPGGSDTTALLNQIAVDVVASKKSIRAALEEGQRDIQTALDNARR